MRFTKTAGDFSAKVITGTHTILMALDCKDERREGLLGFAFKREIVGSGQPAKWLRSLKVFPSIVPDPKNTLDPTDPKKHKAFYTNEFPVQSFLWGDYAASPGTKYRLNIMPMYGKPGALTTDKKDEIDIDIETETEWKPGETHGVWFNRGAIAGQKFAEEFGNKPPQNINDPKDPTVAWLSRGLLEACLDYINSTPAGDALRVAAYEFTYPPILKALKERLDHGVDVQIVYHDTTEEEKPKKGVTTKKKSATTKKKSQTNEEAMKAAGLPINDQKVTYRRSKTKIPHNKFIVRLKGGTEPVEVWTGSTNFTSSGFLGQTNVGHRVADPETARQYLDYWMAVKPDPELNELREKTAALTPNPLDVIAEKSTVRFFSPRAKAEMLGWYGRRMLNAANSLWFTAAFGVSPVLIDPIAKRRDQMRFVLMEKPAPTAARKKLTQDIGRVILSYGVPLGQLYTMKNGKPTARKPIREFELDKWFFEEEHYRPKNDGFVFFVHTKFLLIDPLSDDPLVCSGSANFSSNSLLQNDENMLLVRGNTRVADIYMTEFDRVFRHFYFRDIANELAGKGDGAKSIFLDETDQWTNDYFEPGRQKTNRRLMFFAPHAPTWFENAAAEPSKPSRSTAGTKSKSKGAKKTKRTKKTAKRPTRKKAVKKTKAKAKRAKTKVKRAKTKRAKKSKRKTPKKAAKRRTKR
jgi:phosphatidylserine/phosphatidylglycerophosphate/cardiolipin synthase-like enzyme